MGVIRRKKGGISEDEEVIKTCPICKGTGKSKASDVPFPLWIGK